MDGKDDAGVTAQRDEVLKRCLCSFKQVRRSSSRKAIERNRYSELATQGQKEEEGLSKSKEMRTRMKTK